MTYTITLYIHVFSNIVSASVEINSIKFSNNNKVCTFVIYVTGAPQTDSPQSHAATTSTRSHHERRTAFSEAWQKLLLEFIRVSVAVNAPPSHHYCSLCEQELEDGIYRCLDCHPCYDTLLCLTCLANIHQHAKLHVPQIWEVIHYITIVHTWSYFFARGWGGGRVELGAAYMQHSVGICTTCGLISPTGACLLSALVIFLQYALIEPQTVSHKNLT